MFTAHSFYYSAKVKNLPTLLRQVKHETIFLASSFPQGWWLGWLGDLYRSALILQLSFGSMSSHSICLLPLGSSLWAFLPAHPSPISSWLKYVVSIVCLLCSLLTTSGRCCSKGCQIPVHLRVYQQYLLSCDWLKITFNLAAMYWHRLVMCALNSKWVLVSGNLIFCKLWFVNCIYITRFSFLLLYMYTLDCKHFFIYLWSNVNYRRL